MKRLILVSAMPGTSIQECLQNLKAISDEANSPLAFAVLEKHFTSADGKPLPIEEVLSLWHPELLKRCDAALTSALASLASEKEDTKILSFHPVLYHQITEEFLTPYSSEQLLRAAEKAKLSFDTVLTIQDDVYDIYRRLLGPRRMFGRHKEFGKGRSLLEDLCNERLILDWRDRELAAARTLAAGAKTRFLLLHRRTRADVAYSIAIERRPFAYLSHPISQPRRDIADDPDPDKSRTTDRERGLKLVQEINNFAAELNKIIPVVEPTTLDELRVDFPKLKSLKPGDYKGAISPPLISRWPASSNSPPLGQPIEQDPASTDGPPKVHDMLAPKVLARGLEPAVRMLAEEIRRQINVRDQILAEQADVIVAFRPFSKPNSPAPSGGVLAEIRAMQQRYDDEQKQPGGSNLSIVVVNPFDDEVRRRRNQFDDFWKNEAAKRLDADQAMLKNLRSGLEAIVCPPSTVADLNTNHEALQTEVIAFLRGRTSVVKYEDDSSSMKTGNIHRETEALKKFARDLTYPVICSILHQEAENSDLIKIFPVDGLDASVRKHLVKLSKQGVENGKAQNRGNAKKGSRKGKRTDRRSKRVQRPTARSRRKGRTNSGDLVQRGPRRQTARDTT